jgi:Uma2 family endonuclease
VVAAKTAPKKATYDDVLAAPDHVVAEVVEAVLYTSPRPALRHAAAASVLGEELGPPFRRGRGGPGGWVILYEPELHVGAEPDIVVPDLGGWRRERMPEVPDTAFVTLAPDWVCEVLSPSTAALDRTKKMPVYARERVRHLWLVDPKARTLEVFRLEGASYLVSGAWDGAARVRAEPFDAIELDLALLWNG